MNGSANEAFGSKKSGQDRTSLFQRSTSVKRENNGAGRKENPKSFQARLERGLKSLTNKTAEYRRGKLKSSGKTVSSKLTDVERTVAVGASENTSTSVDGEQCEEDTGDKMRTKPSSRSMRELFSMADSWSSDSVASHSDSCTCCSIAKSNRRQPPCPVHGASSSFEKKFS